MYIEGSPETHTENGDTYVHGHRTHVHTETSPGAQDTQIYRDTHRTNHPSGAQLWEHQIHTDIYIG